MGGRVPLGLRELHQGTRRREGALSGPAAGRASLLPVRHVGREVGRGHCSVLAELVFPYVTGGGSEVGLRGVEGQRSLAPVDSAPGASSRGAPPTSLGGKVGGRAQCHRLTPGALAEEETHPVDLSSLSSKLLPGFTTLGFREERRSRGECPPPFLAPLETRAGTGKASFSCLGGRRCLHPTVWATVRVVAVPWFSGGILTSPMNYPWSSTWVGAVRAAETPERGSRWPAQGTGWGRAGGVVAPAPVRPLAGEPAWWSRWALWLA